MMCLGARSKQSPGQSPILLLQPILGQRANRIRPDPCLQLKPVLDLILGVRRRRFAAIVRARPVYLRRLLRRLKSEVGEIELVYIPRVEMRSDPDDLLGNALARIVVVANAKVFLEVFPRVRQVVLRLIAPGVD